MIKLFSLIQNASVYILYMHVLHQDIVTISRYKIVKYIFQFPRLE